MKVSGKGVINKKTGSRQVIEISAKTVQNNTENTE